MFLNTICLLNFEALWQFIHENINILLSSSGSTCKLPCFHDSKHTEIHVPPAAYPFPCSCTMVVRWSCIQDTVLCEFIDHIIMHRPKIKSYQGVIWHLLPVLMQVYVPSTQTGAEMRCLTIQYSGCLTSNTGSPVNGEGTVCLWPWLSHRKIQ